MDLIDGIAFKGDRAAVYEFILNEFDSEASWTELDDCPYFDCLIYELKVIDPLRVVKIAIEIRYRNLGPILADGDFAQIEFIRERVDQCKARLFWCGPPDNEAIECGKKFLKAALQKTANRWNSALPGQIENERIELEQKVIMVCSGQAAGNDPACNPIGDDYPLVAALYPHIPHKDEFRNSWMQLSPKEQKILEDIADYTWSNETSSAIGYKVASGASAIRATWNREEGAKFGLSKKKIIEILNKTQPKKRNSM